MSIGFDGSADLGQMSVHRVGVAPGQDKADGLAPGRTDRPEDVGPLGALIVGGTRAGSPFGPAARDLVLLADPGFILEPYFDRGRLTEAVQMSFQSPREVFLNASMISRSWPGWRGRALTWLNPSFFRSVPTYRSW